MATGESAHNGGFDTLFTKSVPHILEKIFFTLDYDSFMACGKVCMAWKELHSSESYQQKADELLESKTIFIEETAPKATALFTALCEVLHRKIYRGWGTWYNGLGHNGKGYNGISYNLGNRKGV